MYLLLSAFCKITRLGAGWQPVFWGLHLLVPSRESLAPLDHGWGSSVQVGTRGLGGMLALTMGTLPNVSLERPDLCLPSRYRDTGEREVPVCRAVSWSSP